VTATRCWAIVPAAGQGTRFGSTTPKQYVPLLGRPMISWTLDSLLAAPELAAVCVALAPGDERFAGLPEADDPRVRTCVGGQRRDESVQRALEALAREAADTDWVLVHDAARPCLRAEDLRRLQEELADDSVGGLLAVPLSDTLKRAEPTGHVDSTVPREHLWRAVTPQMFRYGVLRRALALCLERGRACTDEASAIEALGLRPRLVRGHADNVKVTGPEDAELAAAILRARRAEPAGAATKMRIGTGYDVHAYGDGDHVTLGGVRIDHDRGIVAHSDGDVVLHALCDALLGAMGLGDIGQHFPDSDPRWRGADSRQFVRHCADLLRQRGLRVANADLTLLAQAPRVGPHRDRMRATIAQDLGVEPGCVNVKATTTEGLGALGRGEGLACQAVVLLAPAVD
jgi:2-C-methyl-D-erythritol 4-phosphate cytidylyltransferase / 2-C-methyl-D-erythritol 2,4-cyclodiphosphate synthase